jgi:TonB-dependent SusC/RagA subfamily outer membrane receptor
MKNLKIITILLISLTFTLSTYAQKDKEIIISGYVKNSLEEPVRNTFIYVDNIKQDVVTNIKGFYSIKLKKEPTKITFFSIQYGTLYIDYLKGSDKVDVVFKNKESSTQVNNKNSSNNNTKDSNQYRDVFDYLRGKPGIEINNNNQIRIRGINNLNSSTTPMVIINGIEENISRLTDITPSMINSVEVLKKADDTAIYGVRGGNGVIIVKTK